MITCLGKSLPNLTTNLPNVFVHTGLGVDVPRLYGCLEFIINPRVGVELLHEAADVDAGILGSQGNLLVRVSEADELRHVGNPTQLVAQIIEYHSHVPSPGLTGHLLHQALTILDTAVLKDGPALTIFKLRYSEQPSFLAALKPIELELNTLLLVEGCCQGSHGSHMSDTDNYWSVAREEFPQIENVHCSSQSSTCQPYLSVY